MSSLPRRRSALALRLCAALLLLPGLTGPAQAATPAGLVAYAVEAKIAPWVLAQGAAGAPVEFLVILTQQADLSGADALPTKLEKGRYVVAQLRAAAQASQGALRAVLDRRGVDYRPFYVVNALWVKGDLALARTLAARGDVALIDGNPEVTADLGGPGLAPGPYLPASPTGVEASLQYVNADDVWAMGFTGQGIVVGAQDTGYDWDHPALKNQYRGWNGSTVDHDYNWHDSIHIDNNNCPADGLEPCDDDQHGTHTLGTTLGSDGGSNQIGMAPGAKWIGCRNMNDGVGSPATYLECFEFFLAPYPVGGNPLDGNPDLAPDVTNNSWACPEVPEGCSTTSLLAAVEAQRAAGIMTVVSAGNSGPSCNTVFDPPAIHAAVYSIGALDTGTDTIAGFSSRGSVTVDGSGRRKPDLSAPGTNIRSSLPGGGYSDHTWSGTSMAAPHVTGAVALLWSAVPALRGHITETEQVLDDSAVPIASSACGSSGTPNNTYGYGRLDVKAAVDLALALYGVLSGTVTDADTAAPITGAALTLAGAPGNFETSSTALGAYQFAAISGTYTLTATAPGYFAATLPSLSVTAGLTTTQAITLTAYPFHTWLPLINHGAALSVSLYELFEIFSGGALTPY